jgi:hypothetical protein
MIIDNSKKESILKIWLKYFASWFIEETFNLKDYVRDILDLYLKKFINENNRYDLLKEQLKDKDDI